MKQEWLDEAKEYAERLGFEEDGGDLYDSRLRPGKELCAIDIYFLMATFASKKNAELMIPGA